MGTTETIRPLYQYVGIGTGSIRDESFATRIPRTQFTTVGVDLVKGLGARQFDFALTMQLFEHQCTALTELNAFMILEELAILIEEAKGKTHEVLTIIYRAMKHQVYTEGRAIACLIQ